MFERTCSTWDRFLDVMCVGDVREKLQRFQVEQVGLEESAYREWMAKATPASLKAVQLELQEMSQSLGEMTVSDYIVMLKSDVKPTMSDKPLRQRTEAQTIVYHKKALSSLYSSIFRVVRDRFLSLLLPEVHVNLIKNTKDIGDFIRAVHPYGEVLTYLENDFSKYDKSQDAFIFRLEQYVFEQLGMNRELLEKWMQGHVDCTLHSFTTGLSVHLRYQRKSGDATTAFGNVLLNILSCSYAYPFSKVVWAVFMGDDSIIAVRKMGECEAAVLVLAEVFNLSAKMYITAHPYFASHFILVQDALNYISMVPDPIKWIEKRSQPVPADDPCWEERYVSARDAGAVYLNQVNTAGLGPAVRVRYGLDLLSAESMAPAIATALSSQEAYRACYEELPEVFVY